MRDGFLKMTTLAIILASIGASFPAAAADMIYDEDSPSVAGQYRHHRSAGTAYVNTRDSECTDLMIKYRHPYEPHAEIVQVCYPPLNFLGTRAGY